MEGYTPSAAGTVNPEIEAFLKQTINSTQNTWISRRVHRGGDLTRCTDTRHQPLEWPSPCAAGGALLENTGNTCHKVCMYCSDTNIDSNNALSSFRRRNSSRAPIVLHTYPTAHCYLLSAVLGLATASAAWFLSGHAALATPATAKIPDTPNKKARWPRWETGVWARVNKP